MPTHAQLIRYGPPIGIGLVVLAIFVALLPAAFHDPQPRDLPVGVVAPAAAVGDLERGLEARAPGAFALEPLSSAAAARAAVDDRDVVAAAVLTPDRVQLLTAGSAGVGVAPAVTAAFGGLADGTGRALDVRDVRPLGANDSQGLLVFFFALVIAVPALIFRIVAQVFPSLRGLDGASSGGGEAVQLTVFAALTGLVTALVFDLGGMLDGAFWELWLVGGLLALAMTAAIAGLQRVASFGGIALGALLLVASISASGGPLDRRFVPEALAWFSDASPLGAAVDGARGAVYFDGAQLGTAAAVLLAWTAGGLLLLLGRDLVAGGRRGAASSQAGRLTPLTRPASQA